MHGQTTIKSTKEPYADVAYYEDAGNLTCLCPGRLEKSTSHIYSRMYPPGVLGSHQSRPSIMCILWTFDTLRKTID
jgi:hypothetical protein